MIKKLRGTLLFYFIPFMLLTNIQEWASHYGLLSIHKSNALSLNIFTNIEFLFYAWILYQITDNSIQRRRIKVLMSLFILLVIVNAVFLQGIMHFLSYTYLIGSLVIVYLVCYFFYELFHKENYINLYNYPYFWICVGLFFFYLGMFTYYAFFEIVSTNHILKYIQLFLGLMNLFNFILYGCFIKAFLCKPPKEIIS